MAWRAARSLLVLHQQLKAGAPRAAPPATGADEWGLIGDAEHDPTSDHSPHDFPGWGYQIVTAADFPNRPDLGLDAHRVLDDIRRSHDSRVKYGISNGQMFSSYATSSYPAWTWRPYGGKDGHFTHGHLSVVGDARADGTQAWQTLGGPVTASVGGTPEDEDDMGASFGPIDIQREGITSLTIPPVQAGIADPRPAWANFCNATGDMDYGLRVWCSVGEANRWLPLFGTNGLIKIAGAQRVGVALPKGCSGLDIRRWGLNAGGTLVDPSSPDAIVYGGHLTCAIERGAVGSAG